MNKENSFNFERYLESYENSEVSLEDYFDEVALERLCKKVDVVKKLYTLYSSDLKARKSDKEISKVVILYFLEL